jgi:hypothetical protein
LVPSLGRPRTTSPWSSSSSKPAGLRLVVGWSLLAVGDAMSMGDYSLVAVALVTGGTVLVVQAGLGMAHLPSHEQRSWPWTRLSGVIVVPALSIGLTDSLGEATTSPESLLVRLLLDLATVLIAVGLITRWPRQTWFGGAVIVLFVAASVAMIRGNPGPEIDVWYMLQASSHALSHAQNIYATKWTSGIHWQMSDGFAYLPGSAVLLWPFQVLFGDVRYGLLAAMVVTAVLLGRIAPRRSSVALLGTLVLLFPHAVVGIGQAWVDPLVLATLCATAYAVARRRTGWAMVFFALCLLCKQQAWVLLPLALFWKDFGWRRALWSAAGALGALVPWVVTDPRAFYDSAVAYNLFLTPRADSLSLVPTVESFGLSPGVIVTALATAGAVVVVLRHFSRDTFGFLLGSAVVMAVFNLANKQSHYNEWELAAGILLAAIVFGHGRHSQGAAIGQEDSALSAPMPPSASTISRRAGLSSLPMAVRGNPSGLTTMWRGRL